ncbi:MAG: hypothetical protein IT258_03225 [Saprospiraceae bacterium]|nr:hypothetical protein [Saprospiraceae bacterium]
MKVTKLAQLTGHNAAIFALANSKDERHFLSGAGDGWVVEWDLDAPDLGKLLAKLESRIFSILFLRKSNKIVAGDMDGGVHWIDLEHPSATKDIAHHKKGVFAILELENSVITVGGDGKLSKWDLAQMRSTESYFLSNQSLRCIDYCEARNELAVGGSDGAIYRLDATTLELRQKIDSTHSNSVFSLCYSPSAKYLLSGGRDAYLNVWDLEKDFEKINAQPAHLFTINSINFNAEASLFATASRDKTVKIWDASNFELLKVLEGGRDGGHFNSVNKVLWSKAGNLLISAGDDRSIILWKIEN